MKIALNIALWALIVWVFTRFHLPGNTLFFSALQNSGHGVVFFILTIFALKTLGASSHFVSLPSIAIFIVMIAIGLSIETLQHLTGRGASASDLIMNGAGIVSAFILFYAKYRKSCFVPSFFLSILALLLLAWCVHKPFVYVITELYEKPLPILNDFDSTGAGVKILVNDADFAIADHSSVWASNSTRSLKVDFLPGIWPTIVFQETHSRWCDYDQLQFDVLNLNVGSIRLETRVDDASIDFPEHAFMTVSRTLENGAGKVVIPLAELALDALERGEPTFADVTSFMLYLHNNRQTKSLYFDNFRLGKKLIDQKRECSKRIEKEK